MNISDAKEAVRACWSREGVTLKRLADFMGESSTNLHNYGNDAKPESDPRKKSLEWWLKLQRFVGEPIVTQAMAAFDDMVCVPLDANDEEFGRALIRVVGSVGDLASYSAQADEDGRIDASESRNIDRLGAVAQQNIVDLMRAKNSKKRDRREAAE